VTSTPSCNHTQPGSTESQKRTDSGLKSLLLIAAMLRSNGCITDIYLGKVRIPQHLQADHSTIVGWHLIWWSKTKNGWAMSGKVSVVGGGEDSVIPCISMLDCDVHSLVS